MVEQQAIIAERGILYVAYGDRAREQAGVSIRTVRKATGSRAKGLPIAVVSDTPMIGADHQVFHPEADRGARTQKTQMYRLSPFEQTLFLDADTEMLSSPAGGWELLKYVDLVLTQDVTRIFAENHWPHLNRDEVAATMKLLGTGQHMYFNSGVIFFRRNERVAALMDAWHAEWLRWSLHDQMALLRAIHQHPVRIAPMRAPWNSHRSQEAKFIYHKHRAARREGAPQ